MILVSSKSDSSVKKLEKPELSPSLIGSTTASNISLIFFIIVSLNLKDFVKSVLNYFFIYTTNIRASQIIEENPCRFCVFLG